VSPASGAGGQVSGLLTAPSQPAGLVRRWASLCYESLLLAAILLVAGFAALPLVSPSAPGRVANVDRLYVLPAGTRAFVLFYYIAVTGLYFVAFWTSGRRTLPMKTWGLALIQVGGSAVDLRHAIVRFAAAWIGPVAGLCGYVFAGRWGLLAALVNFGWAWLDPDRQFLHDRIAATRIVRRQGSPNVRSLPAGPA